MSSGRFRRLKAADGLDGGLRLLAGVRVSRGKWDGKAGLLVYDSPTDFAPTEPLARYR